MPNQTSKHILNTSANLLGFCLFVITSLHMGTSKQTHRIDLLTSVVAILLTFSCVFSFISIRTNNTKMECLLETTADYLFIVSLVGILIAILMITLNIIHV